MEKIINFPGAGAKVALYTESHVYIGTVERGHDMIDRPGIWLINVTVLPIKSQASPSEMLELGSVLVFWDKVVALGAPPEVRYNDADRRRKNACVEV